ncbi:putative Peptidyl-prolyl cis-trans isomerase [Desulfosarcina cetonica]|uniref:thioredoxin family protein n=1 Tax=Desulfosarcina cetonica TaxID=90730 RepID=UPI0006D0AEBF|nr:thioredoxin family protein [Desulfosarcina cetonica]VTR65941.1 putative Peptidyl-prolyl cis-trans isomerase [Desulfosarcina cetonica]
MNSIQIIKLLMIAACIVMTTAVLTIASQTGDAVTHGNVIEAEVNDFEQLKQIIEKASKEAREKGRMSINIHLAEDPDMVQPADLVAVDYTVFDSRGRIVYATQPEMFAHIDVRYRDPFAQAGAATGSETVLAGFAGLFPGSGQAVLGLRKGERKTVMVPADKSFGPRDEKKIKTYSRQRTFPRTAVIPVDAYIKTFDDTPETGQQVRLSPYFSSRVTGIKDGMVSLENIATDGDIVEDDFGVATINVENDRIVITLDPVIGHPFKVDDNRGIISSKTDTHFYVDYNQPLAGEDLRFDVTVRDLKKFSTFEKIEIPWIEDHETAMDLAFQEQKPLVLLLYADWCQWSQKMLNHTFKDPRIKRFHDRFVWLKIDSDKERMYKTVFEQKDFPMIVLMDNQGEILEKIGGFQDGGTLSLKLDRVLAGKPLEEQTAIHTANPSASSAQHCQSVN